VDSPARVAIWTLEFPTSTTTATTTNHFAQRTATDLPKVNSDTNNKTKQTKQTNKQTKQTNKIQLVDIIMSDQAM
jgi:hypothetical protein